VRIYRVSYRSGGKQKGYDYFDKAIVANAAVMRAKARKIQAEIECYEVPTNREGVLKALNQFGHHPNSE
jgi:hypothetical protein